MNYLLDTHTFLWFINDSSHLSKAAKVLIEEPDHTIYLSVASMWEMAVKISLGKLEAPTPFDEFIDEQLRVNSLQKLKSKSQHWQLL